VEKEKELQLE